MQSELQPHPHPLLKQMSDLRPAPSRHLPSFSGCFQEAAVSGLSLPMQCIYFHSGKPFVGASQAFQEGSFGPDHDFFTLFQTVFSTGIEPCPRQNTFLNWYFFCHSIARYPISLDHSFQSRSTFWEYSKLTNTNYILGSFWIIILCHYWDFFWGHYNLFR